MYKELQETKDRNQRLEQELSINAEKNTHLNEICAQVFDENTALKEKYISCYWLDYKYLSTANDTFGRLLQ